MTLVNKSGTIDYTQRAFHQDASSAMRGNIVRGLIELITNSDDAYASLKNGPKQKKIIIEVEHRRSQPCKVAVKDRATGMSPRTMIERITKLGGRTSGFESGENRRGNLGRGAKDLAAFGPVRFNSIHDGIFCELILQSDGSYKIESKKVTKKGRQQLGIPRGNGTVVTIHVKSTIRIPLHDNLQKQLSTHYQLRDILSDPSRRVELIKSNDGTKHLLTYKYPNLPVVFESDLDIEDYPNANAHLIIHRNPTCYEDGPHDTGRPNGIIIKGNRAIYDNTLFSFEHKQYSGWFSGELISPTIDQLAREYDDCLENNTEIPKNNPIPIISRQREGLNPDHPYYKALKLACDKPLNELIIKEVERAKNVIGDIEDDQTKTDLDRLAREVNRLINEELRDIEAEELPPDTLTGKVPKISIIPEDAFAYMGEDKTLTLAVRKDQASVNDIANIELDPEGVVDLLTPTVPLNPHSRRDDLLTGQIRIRPILEGEATFVNASLNGLAANAIVTVKPPPIIVEEEVEQPETLIFERPSYRIGWKRSKELLVFAPAYIIADYGENVRVTSPHPGIVVRKPTVKLKYDESLDFYKGKVKVEARDLNASCMVTAQIDDLITTTQVKVTRKESGPGLKIRLVDEAFGSWRAINEKEKLSTGEEILVIKIAGRHPSIRPFLSETSIGQNHPVVRSIIAEAVADVASRMVVQELYQIRRTTEDFDAARVYTEHNKRIKRFLPRFQRILIGDPSKILESSLEPVSLIETSNN